MGPFEVYLICIALYAIIVPICWRFEIRGGSSLTVANILWSVIFAFVPVLNAIAVIGGICWIYSNVGDIEVVKGKEE